MIFFSFIECVTFKDDDKEEVVPKQICIDAGFQEPIQIQKCGLSKCPNWMTQAWTPCRSSKCIAKRTGFQTRDVICSIGKDIFYKYCKKF